MTQKVRFTLTMPIELSRTIEKLAQQKGVSKNAMMLEMIWRYLDKKKTG